MRKRQIRAVILSVLLAVLLLEARLVATTEAVELLEPSLTAETAEGLQVAPQPHLRAGVVLEITPSLDVATVVAPDRILEKSANMLSDSETDENTAEEEEEQTQKVEIPEPDPHDVWLMAHLMNGEAGNQSVRCQLAVGAVALNRVSNNRYPNSLEAVIYQRGQYSCTWDGNFDKEPSQQTWDNAYWLLQNELSSEPEKVIPENVVYQAPFPQGSGTWDIIGGQHFCYQ